jgi:hypothetical protein
MFSKFLIFVLHIGMMRVGELEEKIPIRRPKRGSENNFKTGVKEIG